MLYCNSELCQIGTPREVEEFLENDDFEQLLEADQLLQFLLFRLCPECKYSSIAKYVQSPILTTCVCMCISERKPSERKVSAEFTFENIS